MKTSMVLSPALIQKEAIGALSFPKGEVLTSEEAIHDRRIALLKATRLGNVLRNKVKIVFEDTKGVHEVETTVWATAERNISLKGGVVIPIERIHQVKIL